jgi:uncharacterized protein
MRAGLLGQWVMTKFDQLSDFLLGLPDEHDETMLVEELDGFLAGVIVCPDMVLPRRWMPHIWSRNGSEDHAPVFEDLASPAHHRPDHGSLQ